MKGLKGCSVVLGAFGDLAEPCSRNAVALVGAPTRQAKSRAAWRAPELSWVAWW